MYNTDSFAQGPWTKGTMANRTSIVPSAARELLYRLTESLETPFTLTDRDGVVIASTAGRPSGQVDSYALISVRDNTSQEITAQSLMDSPATAHPGLLQPAPGVYVPVRMDDLVAGVLFARGEPDHVRVKAATAAAA